MSERTMRDRYALDRIRPRTPKQKSALLALAGCVLGAALIAFGLHSIATQSQQARERDWINVSGTIQEVRGVLVGQSSGYVDSGARMLYNVQVLAAFQLRGSVEKRWITVGERPTSWDGVEMATRSYKGRHCLVLVNPKNTKRAAVEFTKG
jgi:flavin-binding protein dodecin